MTKNLPETRVLMVDDHPMIIEGYRNALKGHYEGAITLTTDIAHSCDEAVAMIQRNKQTPYDIGLFDINIPPSSDEKYLSGEDIARLFKNTFTKARTIILTMHDEHIRIKSIVQQLDPEGFLIKGDLSSSELVMAFEHVREGKTYYSSTVNKHLRKMFIQATTLDRRNIQILFHLSRGVRTKDLVHHIGISLSAIEKRKSYLRDFFELDAASDELLVAEARKRGLL